MDYNVTVIFLKLDLGDNVNISEVTIIENIEIEQSSTPALTLPSSSENKKIPQDPITHQQSTATPGNRRKILSKYLGIDIYPYSSITLQLV